MAMSATAAAKRRRAGGLLSSPMLQPPHVLQSIPTNRLISTLQNIQQDMPEKNNTTFQSQKPLEQNQPLNNIEGSKILTLQQVIKLLDTRIINLEKATKSESEHQSQFQHQPQPQVEINTSEIISQCQSNVKMTMESSIDEIISRKVEEIKTNMLQTTEAIVLHQMNDFNDRYEILATEILNVKNLLLELQNYTMGVNKMLLEERINIFSEIPTNQFKTTNDMVKLDEEVVVLSESEESLHVEIPIEEPVQNLESELHYEEPAQNLEKPYCKEVVQILESELHYEEPAQNLEEPYCKEVVQTLESELQQDEPADEETVDLQPITESFASDVYNETTQAILNTTINNVESNEEDSEFILATTKGKKGKNAKNQKKKNSMSIEQEVSLSI